MREHPMTAAALLALVVISFLQRPGKVTFDTKLDLAVNPVGFMARSLHLWNPMATSGELQNQAYGYLFPMGPFFALGEAVGLPVWVTQRLWCAAVLCLAFAGALKLARALNIGTAGGRHLGALAYALAPRMLTEIGPISAEMLPAALLPWVLLPLVTVRNPRRAAALSGLAVLCMGGVNAAIVVTVLVLPGLWLVTRPFSGRLLALIGWWIVAVSGAVLWWLVPLVLLGRYSLPFLTFIESAANTTGIVSLLQAARGTNQWVAYVVEGEPWWPAGFMLVDNPVLMAVTAALAAIGLAGLAARGLPQRRFLVLGTLAGLALLTVGFVGALDSPFSHLARHLLDGPLAPLRNVHKFEPVLRLPLVLGLMHALTRIPARDWVLRHRPVSSHRVAAGAVLALVVVVAAPAWLIALRPGPGWSDLPGYWRQAATWLGDRDPDGRTLIVPGTGFGLYSWGRTVDEPIQPLAEAPWAMRTQVPLGSEGHTRVMDTVEEVLAGGQGSAGLAGYLARNGFRHVLLRNDIDRSRPDTPPIAVIRQALARSPGLRLAQEFGPQLAPPDKTRSPVDYGEQPPRLIEIYSVDRIAPLARAVPTGEVATVSGGPESLLPLLEQGLISPDRPTVLAGDRVEDETVAGPWLVTDGLRRRERNVGRVRDNVSQTLTAGEESRQGRASLDFLPFPGPEHQTTAVYRGVRAVTASSALSFADAPGGADPSRMPFAAVDGDLQTAWISAAFTGPVGQWLETTLDTPRRIPDVSVTFVDDVRVGWKVTRFRLTTDRGSIDHDVKIDTALTAEGLPRPAARYALPAGLTTSVRVTVLAVAGGNINGNVGIAELGLGIATSRSLKVPDDQTGAVAPPAYAFSRGHFPRGACYPAANEGDAVRCDATLARGGEEAHGLDRLFRTPLAARYGLGLTAVARPGASPPLTASYLEAWSSSQLGGDPRVGALAAIDGDPNTAWLADVNDPAPMLQLFWPDQRTLDRIQVRFPGRPVGARPTTLELRTPNGNRTVALRADGSGTFDPVVSDKVAIVVTGFEPRVVDRRTGAGATTGFAEVTFPALAQLRPPVSRGSALVVPCGQGPVVELDGVRFQTSVTGTIDDFVGRQPLAVTICDLFAADALDLAAGEHRLVTEPSATLLIQDATLRPVAAGPLAGSPPTRSTAIERWQPTDRSIRVAAGPESLLVIAENANSGWRATLGGRPLRATRVDGWQQAWVVPEGAGGVVRLEFTPDVPYRRGLAAGAGAALLVVLLAVVPPLRRRPEKPEKPMGRSRSAPILFTLAATALVVALSGVLALVLLIAGALVRQVYPRAMTWIVLGGAGFAAAVAISGRLDGHGQADAYGWLAQAAMLVAICSGVAAAAVRVPGAPDLDDQADRDEQPGHGGGRSGDGRDGAVERHGDEPGLGADGEPDGQDRPDVAAGDPGEEQELGDGEQRPGEREDPDGDGLPAVSRAADDR